MLLSSTRLVKQHCMYVSLADSIYYALVKENRTWSMGLLLIQNCMYMGLADRSVLEIKESGIWLNCMYMGLADRSVLKLKKAEFGLWVCCEYSTVCMWVRQIGPVL